MGARRALLSERFHHKESELYGVPAPESYNLPADGVSEQTGARHLAYQRGHRAKCTAQANGIGPRRVCSFSTVVILNATLTSFLFGYNVAVTNSCMNAIALQNSWCGNSWDDSCQRSQIYQSIINSIVFVGAIFGSLASSCLVRWGRRRSLQTGCVAFFVGGMLGAIQFSQAHAAAQLILSRVVSGIGLGIVTVVTPIYISEMTQPKDRGFYGAIHQVLIGFGIFISIAVGLPLTPNTDNSSTYVLPKFDAVWWRAMFAFQCVPAAICFTVFSVVWTNESPHWSMHNGQNDEAVDTVKRIYAVDEAIHVEEPLVDILRAVTEAKELQSITLFESMKDRFYRYGILLGLFLAVLQQLCGVNVIVSSSNDLFVKAGMRSAAVTWVSTGMALSNVIASLVAAPVVESFGRRKLLLWGLIGQLFATGPVGIIRYLSESHHINLFSSETTLKLSVGATFVFLTAFSLALGPVVWIYLSEIYPVEIKGRILGWCGVSNWFTAFLVVFSAKFMNLTQAYLLFSGVCLVGYFVTFQYVLETKGTSINDSPISPRSMRSESSLIQRSISNNSLTALDDLRKKIRSSSSTTRVLIGRMDKSCSRDHACTHNHHHYLMKASQGSSGDASFVLEAEDVDTPCEWDHTDTSAVSGFHAVDVDTCENTQGDQRLVQNEASHKREPASFDGLSSQASSAAASCDGTGNYVLNGSEEKKGFESLSSLETTRWIARLLNSRPAESDFYIELRDTV